jgi:hypothetical protein
MQKGEPMSWKIAETVPGIEKIKSESTNYLIWLDCCGIINYDKSNYVSDFYANLLMKAYEQGKKDAHLEIVRCKDCEYGEQDEVGRWFCSDLGCQIGDEDGSGFCADAERRTDEE